MDGWMGKQIGGAYKPLNCRRPVRALRADMRTGTAGGAATAEMLLAAAASVSICGRKQEPHGGA